MKIITKLSEPPMVLRRGDMTDIITPGSSNDFLLRPGVAWSLGPQEGEQTGTGGAVAITEAEYKARFIAKFTELLVAAHYESDDLAKEAADAAETAWSERTDDHMPEEDAQAEVDEMKQG